MDKRERAEAAFERVWDNFRLDKARLRTLNEKEKVELKSLMKTVFLSSMTLGEIPTEISLKVEGDSNPEVVESAVRRVLKEELGGITGLLQALKDRPVETRVIQEGSRDVSTESQEVVSFHAKMFEADEMSTNIDNVKVSGDEVKDVKSNLEALRRLQNKKDSGDGA